MLPFARTIHVDSFARTAKLCQANKSILHTTMQTNSTSVARTEGVSNIWRDGSPPLDAILAPKSIALIGATENEGSVGRTLVENIRNGGFKGQLHLVNPKRDFVMSQKAYRNVGEIPNPVDLAVIVTPAQTVPGIVAECARTKIPGAVIISAGFKETGADGAALEAQILQEARRSKMRIIGPNCLGVMRPHFGLNATFAAGMARPGSVAFISQSGALCTAILDWSFRENVGFSAFISIGSMLDVGWGDLIYHLGDDPHTRSIVIYMEAIGDARSFLSAAREVALTKPIIVMKVGRTEQAAKAAASHTGSLTGSDEVLHAALRRVGVLRVDTIAELFDMSEVLAKQPRPQGPRLAIVTNAGGPGVLATDMLIGSGGELSTISPNTISALNEVLPSAWSHNNPIDILGDANAERYAKAVEIAAKDPANDGLLVVLTPQAMTDPTATAQELTKYANLAGKPLLASWMGAGEVENGEEILNAANIPTFKYPDRAARAFADMWRYSYNLKSLYETPAANPTFIEGTARQEHGEAIIQAVRKAGRTLLTEFESKKLLKAYNIPTVETHIATSADKAVETAEQIGYPVVLKLHSHVITHKTDAGGVQLNLANAAAVRRAYKSIETSAAQYVKTHPIHGDEAHAPEATSSKKKGAHQAEPPFLGVTVQPMVKLEGYELILGSSPDPQFGPVILFGAGGQLVEIFKDSALGLPPLNATLARRLMERTQIFHALKGVRGRKPVDLAALEQLLASFSQLVIEQPWIAEIDVNPLLVSPEGFLALDARVVTHGLDVREADLPRAAIRPYPSQYVRTLKVDDSTHVTLRPIRPEDEPLIAKFHETLSEESVYYRYFTTLKLPERVAHERLTRICFNDYDHEIALVVEHKNPKTHQLEILAVGRLTKLQRDNAGEFALLVSDPWQRRGLGTDLLKTLVQVGRNEKLSRITGFVLPENHGMQKVCKRAGFELVHDKEAGQWEAVIKL
jgi:acetyltransferase